MSELKGGNDTMRMNVGGSNLIPDFLKTGGRKRKGKKSGKRKSGRKSTRTKKSRKSRKSRR